ncbi:MAG: hypothetical protein H6732_09680 [Alphaproteobacteria bacterium]|nr:hypothetical protein [Alphaproteobacteria bacterium]
MKDVAWRGPRWPAAATVRRWRGPRAAQAVGRLVATWEAMDAGGALPRDPVALLEEAGGTWPPRAGDAPMVVAEAVSTDVLARVALDVAPASGDDGPREALGAFAETLDLADPWHRRAWTAAVAALCLYVSGDDPRSPYRSWLKDRAGPAEPEREAALAVGRAPWGAWRLAGGDGDGWRVAPLLPVRPCWTPDGPVDLSEAGGVRGGPRPGGLLLARLVPTTAGWVARMPFLLPVAPPATLARGWLASAAFPLLAATPELSLEDVLRRGGHRVVAEAHAWAAGAVHP